MSIVYAGAGRQPEDPYERALRDIGFLNAVAEHHRGSWPVRDALWWSAHPDQESPSGSGSPAERRRALQRRLFAADGDAAGDTAVAEDLRALEAEIAAERAAITVAVAAAESGAESGVVGVPDADLAGSVTEPAPAEETGDTRADLGDGRRGWGSRRVLSAATALAVAAALGAVAGGVLDHAPQAEPVVASAARPTASATPRPTIGALAVFARQQGPNDIPTRAVSAEFTPESFRYLGAAGWSDEPNAVGPSPVYAARGAGDMVCLVAVPDAGGYLSTCALESGFPSLGLRLYWEIPDYALATGIEVGPSSENQPLVGDMVVSWDAGGDFSAQWGGRM